MLQANESRLPVLQKQVSGGVRRGVGMQCRDAACRVTGATYTIQLRGTPRPYIVEVGKNESIWRYLKPKPRHKWQVVAEALHISGTEKVAAGLAAAIGLIVFQEEGSIEDDALHKSIGHRW